jgi:hypothetical protein
MAQAPECTYTGPVSTQEGTLYYVTRSRYQRGRYVRVTTTTTREPKNCENVAA